MSKQTLHLPTRHITQTLLHHRPLSRIPLRIPPSHHAFHSTPHPPSALFNLGGLSTSRESQYLSKERGIPRTEFSPHLELIRSSEVDTQKRASDLPPPASSKRPKATLSTPPKNLSAAENKTGARAQDELTVPKSAKDLPAPSQQPSPLPTLAHLQDSLARLQTSHNALEARFDRLDRGSSSIISSIILVLAMGTVIYMICRPPDLDNFVDARIRKHEAEREKELGTRIERNTEEGEEVERIVEDDAILPAATAAAGAAEATMPRRRERAWGFADLVWARRD